MALDRRAVRGPRGDRPRTRPRLGGGILARPLVFWFRVVTPVLDLATGEPLDVPSVVCLLRTSPANVWDDFTLSRYQLSSTLQGSLIGIGSFFLVSYGLAVLLAATMIVSITRSTARLTRGAREVGRGNLAHRILVKRRDQLGDLAVSFNAMTGSVQEMLAKVADRERLARELELAREIQESLLPNRQVRHGSLTVYGTFRPAAEVGGDYFDIFPLSDDRLVVVVGDVAGHGLHTGLLMATLKSSVAALVQEGYSGARLIDRANRLMMEHGAGRTMATLSVVEIDPRARMLELANAGHPPAYLLTAASCDELLTSSLPIGGPLCEPQTLSRPFPDGALLVLYSDGLVEAGDPSGEPFGYRQLAQLLSDARTLPGPEVAAAVLGALDRWVDGRALEDDLTLVVIDGGEPDDAPDGSR